MGEEGEVEGKEEWGDEREKDKGHMEKTDDDNKNNNKKKEKKR